MQFIKKCMQFKYTALADQAGNIRLAYKRQYLDFKGGCKLPLSVMPNHCHS